MRQALDGASNIALCSDCGAHVACCAGKASYSLSADTLLVIQYFLLITSALVTKKIVLTSNCHYFEVTTSG